MAPWGRGPGEGSIPGISDASLHAVLARALELPEREQRLAALRTLETKAPDAPPILFHLALELALAGQNEAARAVGDRLNRISPAYYRRLYEVAERHWPTDNQPRMAGAAAKALQATKMLILPPQAVAPPPQSQPQPLPAQRTKILPELGGPQAQPMAQYNPYATALMSLPPPPQRAGVPVRTIVFLTVGVFMGVLLVVLLNWLLPTEPGSLGPGQRPVPARLA